MWIIFVMSSKFTECIVMPCMKMLVLKYSFHGDAETRDRQAFRGHQIRVAWRLHHVSGAHLPWWCHGGANGRMAVAGEDLKLRIVVNSCIVVGSCWSSWFISSLLVGPFINGRFYPMWWEQVTRWRAWKERIQRLWPHEVFAIWTHFLGEEAQLFPDFGQDVCSFLSTKHKKQIAEFALRDHEHGSQGSQTLVFWRGKLPKSCSPILKTLDTYYEVSVVMGVPP